RRQLSVDRWVRRSRPQGGQVRRCGTVEGDQFVGLGSGQLPATTDERVEPRLLVPMRGDEGVEIHAPASFRDTATTTSTISCRALLVLAGYGSRWGAQASCSAPRDHVRCCSGGSGRLNR